MSDETISPNSNLADDAEHEKPKKKHGGQAVQKSKAMKHAMIIQMAQQDFGATDIAAAVGLPRTTVNSILKKFEKILPNRQEVKSFREAKADILSAAQMVVLESAMSGKKLAKAGFLSTIQAADILNKMERLDLGQSTENHGHQFFQPVSIPGEQVIDVTADSKKEETPS